MAERYGLAPAQLQLLTDNPADGVYGFTRTAGRQKAQRFVLKCTRTSDRSRSTLQAQVEWLNFLADHDAPVCRVLPSPHGELVEQIEVNGTAFSVVCYAHAPGERPGGADWTAEFFQIWGQVIGKLHSLTSQYRPARPTWPIEAWHEGMARSRQAIPVEQTRVLEKFDALLAHFQSLPIDKQSFGLIHHDLQANNLRLHHGALTVIDFDDCLADWFVSDLATALYFTLWENPRPDQNNGAFAAFIMENLLAGYRRERALEAGWIEQIPLFLKRQEMAIYLAIHEFNQAARPGQGATLSAKHQALLTRYRHNIEHDIPYIDAAYNPWQRA
jgi:Ser/Thr protein kinase RdoA (MazF antagonist)